MGSFIKYLIIGLLFGVSSCSDKTNVFGKETKVDLEKIESELQNDELKYRDVINLWKENLKEDFFLSKKIDDFNFTAIYKPYTILAMDEDDSLRLNEKVISSFKQKLKAYSNMHFLTFNIENKTFKSELIKYGVENNQEYYDRIAYYSFTSLNDAYVIEDDDTLKCSFVNFERTYEVNPSITLSFAFTRKSKQQNYQKIKFVFEDRVFNKGKLMFDFNTPPILLLNYLKPLS